MSVSGRIIAAFERHGFRNLLFSLLFYSIIDPFLQPFPSLKILAHFFLCIALFLSVYAIQQDKKRRISALILLMPLLLFYWLGIYDVFILSRPASYILFICYYGLLVYNYIKQLARFERVTMNVLYGALCLYLIIGLLWGALYALLFELDPGSYSGTLLTKAGSSTLEIFNYFSMVTLTTLGYGDITPQTAAAGALCQVEAVIGQFFTAVVVGWMVGNIVSVKGTGTK